ncbi:MAG: hypothetical protein LQ338_008295, partial [Usnochroma carphineum]
MVQYPYPVPTPAYQQAQPPLQQNFYCAACGYNLGHWYSRNLCWPYQCPQCRVRTVDHPFLGGPSVYQQQAAAPAPPAPPQLGPELEWPETNIVHEHRRAMPNLVYQREEAIPSGRPTPAPKPHAGTAAFHTSRQWTAAGVVPDKVPPKFTKFSDRIVKMRATIQSKKYI